MNLAVSSRRDSFARTQRSKGSSAAQSVLESERKAARLRIATAPHGRKSSGLRESRSRRPYHEQHTDPDERPRSHDRKYGCEASRDIQGVANEK